MRPERFEVKAKARGFKPGIDLTKLNQLVDELEIGDFKRKTADNTDPTLVGYEYERCETEDLRLP